MYECNHFTTDLDNGFVWPIGNSSEMHNSIILILAASTNDLNKNYGYSDKIEHFLLFGLFIPISYFVMNVIIKYPEK